VGCYGSYTVVQLPGNDESTGHRKTHPGAIFVGGGGFGIFFFYWLVVRGESLVREKGFVALRLCASALQSPLALVL